MKKKLISSMLAFALMGVCVLSAETTAVAGTNTYKDAGALSDGVATQDGLAEDPEKNVSSINVQAKITGGEPIQYNVKIDWGEMQFEYDYGSKWNPETHSYDPGSTNSQNGGWNLDYLDGVNNRITVTNNSNYPIKADFAYENTVAFNENTSSTSVAGMFHAANDDLKSAVSANTIDTMTLTAPPLALNTCTDNLRIGEKYYYQGSDDNTYVGEMYFSLIGKPDRGISLTTMQQVGSIKVTITPATATTQKTKA